MKTMSVLEAEKKLTNLIGGLENGPVLLLRHGRPCAALIGLGERFDREAFALGQNKRLRRMVDDACRTARKTGGVTFSEIEREIRQRPGRDKTRQSRSRAKGS